MLHISLMSTAAGASFQLHTKVGKHHQGGEAHNSGEGQGFLLDGVVCSGRHVDQE